ncbi:hypothetical protein BpHYR1_031984 [Brachionus plicatilis]|uniref:Uncharacterized protein n=1 Tax=Brachionus plicatilis TaxID=10195 RepID=A0A3M7QEW2_BRAPC|nr:hypothetical protein BpHYR1_031984 [Brachionus plicatilis]
MRNATVTPHVPQACFSLFTYLCCILDKLKLKKNIRFLSINFVSKREIFLNAYKLYRKKNLKNIDSFVTFFWKKK